LSEVQGVQREEERTTLGRPAAKAPSAGGQQLQLKRSVRAAEGFDAQSALLAPVQMLGGWPMPFAFGGGGQANANQPGGQANANQPGGQANANQQAGQDANEGAAPNAPVPDLPRDFGAEGVLRTWISEFNKSLVKRADKRTGVNKMHDKLKQKGWADDSGLSYELLAAAAALEPVTTPQGQQPVAGQEPAAQNTAPAPVSNARILAMMAKNNALLNKVITPEYQGKCMQFSQQMMKSMGAKRADGSTDTEKRQARMGPLTAQYRGKNVKDLPPTLPAGYQICITSMPEWGFTEVGNHWFISAGDGYYLDNTSGVFSGAAMTANLRGATGDQWGSRVVDLQQNALRTAMGDKFVTVNSQFKDYHQKGRTALEKKKDKSKGVPNPDYKDEGTVEKEGREKIKAFVLGTPTYWPRIWVVEPTTKDPAAQGGQ